MIAYGKMDNADDRMAVSCFNAPSAIRLQKKSWKILINAEPDDP
jgi:hypothetical protein